MMSSARPTLDRAFENLRRVVSRMKRGRGHRYPKLLRERVVRWASARRQHGAKWHQLSRELGISAESLRRWVLLEEPGAPALVPVEVVAQTQTRERLAADRVLCVITRAGHRIEGLSLADVIELVRVLG